MHQIRHNVGLRFHICNEGGYERSTRVPLDKPSLASEYYISAAYAILGAYTDVAFHRAESE